ncbi:MAG: hypothetical protein GXP18_00445 [Gammaproteobacteria bacterium]|nr:hypothetical protein [Gammaproteobacteria bacterium]
MKKLLLYLVTILILAGCGTYQQTTQVDDSAYLLIIGDPAGYVVTIDNTKPLKLEEDTVSFDLDGKTVTKIKLSTGTHAVKIMKNGKLKINRKFYVSNGNSFEVRL